ncbi:hypothetical protein BDV11DRAFT_45090 [Aspergillus similis]
MASVPEHAVPGTASENHAGDPCLAAEKYHSACRLMMDQLFLRTVPARLANLTAIVITIPLVIRRTAPSEQKGSRMQIIK